MKHRKIWAVIAIVVLASLACSIGGIGGGEAPEEPSAPPPAGEESGAEAPPSEEGGEEEAPLPEVASDALSGLDSYRARTVTQWTPEGGSPESFMIEQEETRDPPASRFLMTSSENPDESMEWVQIGDTAWMCFGGTCAQTQPGEEEFASTMGDMLFEPADLLSGSDYRYVGRETVNGIATRHYILSLSPADMAVLAQAEVSSVEAETWIADETDLPTFVVRYVLRWTGTQDGETGDGELSFEVYDVNAPITIEPPEGATTGFPEGVPEYTSMQDLVIMEGFISFSTTDDAATVADFYRAQLASLGWTAESDDEMEMGAMVIQTWSKDGQSLSLMISTQEGTTSVVITVE